MIMYCKLFASLYQGTLRGRGDEILVFTNLLAHADQHGICDKHWRAIADETGLTVDAVKTAIVGLEAPDPESRSPEMDGCRIVRMDGHRAWGWQIVNYGKYRAIRNEDDRREANRLAQERWRNKNKPPSATVSRGKPKEKQKQKDKDKNNPPIAAQSPPKGQRFTKPTLEEVELYCKERENNVVAQRFLDYYESQGWKKANGRPLVDWQAAVRTWEQRDKQATESKRAARLTR